MHCYKDDKHYLEVELKCKTNPEVPIEETDCSLMTSFTNDKGLSLPV